MIGVVGMDKEEQKLGSLDRNKWIILAFIIVFGGIYNILLFAFFGDSISSLNNIPIIGIILSLLFFISFSFGSFLLATLLNQTTPQGCSFNG